MASTYSVSKGLRAIRVAKGLTCREVDQEVGLPLGKCTGLEGNEAGSVSLRTLVKLADFYNVTLDELVMRRTDKRTPLAIPNEIVREMMKRDKTI